MVIPRSSSTGSTNISTLLYRLSCFHSEFKNLSYSSVPWSLRQVSLEIRICSVIDSRELISTGHASLLLHGSCLLLILWRWWAMIFSWSAYNVGTPSPLIANLVRDPDLILILFLCCWRALLTALMMSCLHLIGWSSTEVMMAPQSMRFQCRILVGAIVLIFSWTSSMASFMSGCVATTSPIVGWNPSFWSGMYVVSYMIYIKSLKFIEKCSKVRSFKFHAIDFHLYLCCCSCCIACPCCIENVLRWGLRWMYCCYPMSLLSVHW